MSSKKQHIPYSRQNISEEDIEAVVQALRSDYITQGPRIEQFECSIAEYCSVPHVVAISSGTSALHAAYAALGVAPGDIVWTAPISFVATSNAALYLGAEVDFVDVDRQTGCMDLSALRKKLEQAKSSGKLPKVLVPVHLSGRTVDMKQLREIVAGYEISIVEDASHALGACYHDGTRVGSNACSNATVFSFHPVKPVTTGEGGAITFSNDEAASIARMFRTSGISRDANRLENKNMPAWYYEQQILGYNYRLTDIQAALGLSQMNRLDEFIDKRRALAQRYQEKLASLPFELPPADSGSGWHLYIIQCPSAGTGSRDSLFEFLRSQGILVNVHYIPIHLQPYYQSIGFKKGDFPAAEEFFQKILSLPIYPQLTFDQQDFVISKLEEWCQNK